MKIVILLSLASVIAITFAAPQDQEVQITKNVQEVVAPERFSYDFELSDQTKAKQSGSIGNNPLEPALQVEGEYSYISKEGDRVRVTYTADSTGYKPLVYINEELQNPPA